MVGVSSAQHFSRFCGSVPRGGMAKGQARVGKTIITHKAISGQNDDGHQDYKAESLQVFPSGQ
eukprot:3283384-Amphidinium_carterae.1